MPPSFSTASLASVSWTMLAASLELINIGLLLIREYNIFFVREASSPCNGNHFLVIIVRAIFVLITRKEGGA